MEDFIQYLTNFDPSSLSDSVALWAAVIAGSGYTATKDALRPFWERVEPYLGFAVSTLVVFSLWFALLRVHVSVSFNLDKEAFDNLLWWSALTYTPYYLVKYHLVERTCIFLLRTLELVSDLFIFSWFEGRAAENRIKWRSRFNRWVSFK